MKFCQDHWDRLRAEISKRGLDDLVADDAALVARRMESELETGATTLANFDPLMSAHWAIANNAMEYISRAGGSPLYLLAGEEVPEDPVEGYGPEYEGRTWPRCPLCYLNLAHEMSCSDPRCRLDRKRGFDWMVVRAADDSRQRADELLKAEQ